jgi:hypothetical protein
MITYIDSTNCPFRLEPGFPHDNITLNPVSNVISILLKDKDTTFYHLLKSGYFVRIFYIASNRFSISISPTTHCKVYQL